MPTLIPFDDDLVDTIQEFRGTNKPLASEAGLLDRIIAAIYHGIDAPPSLDDGGTFGRGQIERVATQVQRGKSRYDDHSCDPCFRGDYGRGAEHTCGVW